MRLVVVGFCWAAAVLRGQETGAGPFDAVAPVSEGLRFEAQVPSFEAKDTTGRMWRSEDLRGKITLVYVWNTFEARDVDAHARVREVVGGISNLPEVQRFYEKTRGAKNIQTLTFCRDYDYTHAAEYMKERKYSFPVIADWVLVKKLFANAAGIPSYWVVDREGRLSNPIRSWSLGRVMYEIEKMASRGYR
jgi:hypothetical protein